MNDLRSKPFFAIRDFKNFTCFARSEMNSLGVDKEHSLPMSSSRFIANEKMIESSKQTKKLDEKYEIQF